MNFCTKKLIPVRRIRTCINDVNGAKHEASKPIDSWAWKEASSISPVGQIFDARERKAIIPTNAQELTRIRSRMHLIDR